MSKTTAGRDLWPYCRDKDCSLSMHPHVAGTICSGNDTARKLERARALLVAFNDADYDGPGDDVYNATTALLAEMDANPRGTR